MYLLEINGDVTGNFSTIMALFSVGFETGAFEHIAGEMELIRYWHPIPPSTRGNDNTGEIKITVAGFVPDNEVEILSVRVGTIRTAQYAVSRILHSIAAISRSTR
jgi:hypothetical protein